MVNKYEAGYLEAKASAADSYTRMQDALERISPENLQERIETSTAVIRAERKKSEAALAIAEASHKDAIAYRDQSHIRQDAIEADLKNKLEESLFRKEQTAKKRGSLNESVEDHKKRLELESQKEQEERQIRYDAIVAQGKKLQEELSTKYKIKALEKKLRDE